jgi:serine protease
LADDEGFGVDAVGALTAAVPEHAARVAAAIDQVVGPTDIARIFSRRQIDLAFDRLCGERWTGEEMPDLSQFLLLNPRDRRSASIIETLAASLNALDFVELAYLEPRTYPGGMPAGTNKTTRDFELLQGYLDPAPIGVDAVSAWGLPGGTGQYVKLIDVELGWNVHFTDPIGNFNPGHEDLPWPFVAIGNFNAGIPYSTRHGTAVLGIVAGQRNGFGITGIAHGSPVGVAAAELQAAPTANAVDLAAAVLSPFEVVLLEYQIAGPPGLAPGSSCPGEIDPVATALVPAEFDYAIFSAVRTATANSRIVVAAAGNYAVDLEHPLLQGRFDPYSPAFIDSGAILVGSRQSSGGAPMCATNFGKRVDASAWGENVVTAGWMADLPPGDTATYNNQYTDSFGGTSSAAAIVAGAILSVQSMQVGRSRVLLPPMAMRTLLRVVGTPQAPDYRPIGRMPDLTGAYQWLPLDDDGDGMSNDVELALNRHPRLNEGALVSALVLVLED